jgi:hypothetical protein
MNPYQTIEVLMGVIYSLKEQMAKMEVNCTECARMSEPCATQTTDQVIEALRLHMAKMQSTDPLDKTSTTDTTVSS